MPMPTTFTAKPLAPSERDRFLARLGEIVGAAHLHTDPERLAPWLTDWRGRYTGRVLAAVQPGDTGEIQAVVRACRAAGVPMVPQGGNTGLCGGATPDASGRAVLIRLERLDRLRAFDRPNRTLIAEAGCTLARVQAAAEAGDCLFPLSLASEGSCQIGGNLATNAGGVQVLRYGTMRDLTLGLEAVLPNGEIWNGLTALRKNNTGYDLRHLLIGAEGTLGIITAAVLKLFPRPTMRVTAWLGLVSPAAALALLERAQDRFDAQLTAFELICPRALGLVRHFFPEAAAVPAAPWHVLCEFAETRAPGEASGLAARVENFLAEQTAEGGLCEAVLAQSESQRRALWALRENISEAQKREGPSVKHDIALPVSAVATFLERAVLPLARVFPGIRHVAFGHLGDGNLHFNLSMADAEANRGLLARQAEANRIVHDLVHELGGSISAEHGLGQLKREEIRRYKAPAELAAMAAIKHAIDPEGLMNPGKIL